MTLPASLLDRARRGKRKDGGRTETELTAAIITYLNARGDIWVWRVNTGGRSSPEVRDPATGRVLRRKRVTKFNPTGTPDISGLVKGSGRRLEVEVKRPGEEPTPVQAARLRLLHDAGAVAFWATSIVDAERALLAHGLPARLGR